MIFDYVYGGLAYDLIAIIRVIISIVIIIIIIMIERVPSVDA